MLDLAREAKEEAPQLKLSSLGAESRVKGSITVGSSKGVHKGSIVYSRVL